MGVNLDKPSKWKDDIAASVDYYNKWFLDFAPTTFRDVRTKATIRVNQALEYTDNLMSLSVESIIEYLEILPM